MTASWKLLLLLLLLLLPALPALPAAGHGRDSRDMAAGSLIHTWAYSDQPYCVVATKPEHVPHGAKSLWVCAVTVNDGAHEGAAGEHIVSVTSADQGVTWTEPLALEPDRTIDNAYSTITLCPSGRIYVSCECARAQQHTAPLAAP